MVEPWRILRFFSYTFFRYAKKTQIQTFKIIRLSGYVANLVTNPTGILRFLKMKLTCVVLSCKRGI